MGKYRIIAAILACAGNAAAEPVSTQDKTWSDLVNYAIGQSSAQNNGSPRFQRQCNPAAGLCTNYLSFRTADGKLQTLSNHQDASDRTVLRLVCQTNNFGDMAHCIDFDTGAKHDEIKDPATGKFVRLP